MRVNLGTVDVPDRLRRGLAIQYGTTNKSGMASRDEIRQFVVDHGMAILNDEPGTLADEEARGTP